MPTKIQSHRIEEKAVKNEHLSDDFVIQETGNHLSLNYPTHSNANDLTTTQRLILTQGGNADGLHYHMGGGGGQEGIYTHPEIDAALLQIMMQLNSIKYKLPSSIVDTFDDDSGIDYGIVPPVINEATEELSLSGNNTLEADSTYYYKVAAKHKDGETVASAPFKVNTSSATEYRSIVLDININPDNKGIKIWRSKTNEILREISFDRYPNLYSPYALKAELLAPDASFNNKSAMKLDYIGPNAQAPNDIDVLSTSNGAKITCNGTKDAAGNPVWCAITPLQYEVGQLQIVWSTNPAYIPLDYIVEYSEVDNPDWQNDGHWQRFIDLDKVIYQSSQQTFTDGDIVDSTVIGNTKANNYFTFKRRKITGIRLTCTKLVSAYSTPSVKGYYLGSSNGEYVIQRLPVDDFDISKYKTLMVDVKPDENPYKYSIGLMDTNEYNAGVQSNLVTYNTSNTNSNISATANRVFRSRIYIGSRNDSGYNRIRIGFRKGTSNSRVRITNVTIGLNNSGNADVFPETIAKATFEGLDYYDKTDTNDYIYTDYIPMNFSQAYTYVIISFVLEVGTLYSYGSNGNMYTWCRDGDTDYCFDVSGSGWGNYQGNYTYGHYVEIGKSYKNTRLELLPGTFTAPFTHILDISGINGITALRGIAYVLENISQSGKAIFSNLRFNNIIDLCKSKVSAVTVTSGSNPGYAKNGIMTNYWESGNIPTVLASENIMFKFNTAYVIDRIRFCEDVGGSYGFESYTIQYTINADAKVDDPYDSPNWTNVENLEIVNGKDNGFNGTIENGKVMGNTMARVYIDHKFTDVSATAVRIIFHKTTGNTVIRLYDTKIYTAETDDEYVLIHNISNTVDENLIVVDNGIVGTLSTPNDINTTGSYNIVFDKVNGYIKVFDKTKEGVFISELVDVDNFLKFLVTVQEVNKNNSKYYISNDDGHTWTPIIPDQIGSLVNPGDQFRFKAVLKGDDILNAYGVLYTL